jgi:hypothetical protein
MAMAMAMAMAMTIPTAIATSETDSDADKRCRQAMPTSDAEQHLDRLVMTRISN